MVRYLPRTENSVRNHIERTNELVVLTTNSKKTGKYYGTVRTQL